MANYRVIARGGARGRRGRRRRPRYDIHGCRSVWIKSHARTVCKRGARPGGGRHIRFAD